MLFLIYINDLVNSTTLGKFVLFADDTNIFVTGKDEKSAYIVLEKVHEYIFSNQSQLINFVGHSNEISCTENPHTRKRLFQELMLVVEDHCKKNSVKTKKDLKKLF